MTHGMGRHTLCLVIALAALALVSAPADARADGYCAPGVDTCLIVNTVADANVRDDGLSLREALHVANGELPISALTPLEAAQVHLGAGLAGVVEVNFDAGLFAPGAGAVITLLPPGLGGGDVPTAMDPLPPGLNPIVSGSGLLLALPPGLGGGDVPGVNDMPPGLGGGDVPNGLAGAQAIGGGVVNGQRVPVAVTIDGSALGAGYVGLWNREGGTLRDLHLANFAGHAIEVKRPAMSEMTYENVTFAGNAADVVRVQN